MKDFKDYKNILVYRFGHLGDTIVALPAFWRIRERFPNSKLTLLTNSDSKNKNYVMAKNILPENGLFDSYIFYDNAAQTIKKTLGYAELFFKLKQRKFDCLFYLSTRNRTDYQIERDIKFFTFSGIRNIYGAELVKSKQLDFSEPKPLPTVKPEYEFLIDCLSFENAAGSKINHNLKLTGSEYQTARAWFLQSLGNNYTEKKIVAVAPGSKWASKIWFEDRYVQVLNKLIQEFGVVPIIFGGREDFETGQKIIEKLGIGFNSAGYFSIRESSAALEFCTLYLGNDTGTMHLAASVGTPCVGIFAATDYRGRWYPFGENNEIFRSTVECEGCHTPVCFNSHKCLELISVDEVLKACRKILVK